MDESKLPEVEAPLITASITDPTNGRLRNRVKRQFQCRIPVSTVRSTSSESHESEEQIGADVSDGHTVPITIEIKLCTNRRCATLPEHHSTKISPRVMPPTINAVEQQEFESWRRNRIQLRHSDDRMPTKTPPQPSYRTQIHIEQHSQRTPSTSNSPQSSPTVAPTTPQTPQQFCPCSSNTPQFHAYAATPHFCRCCQRLRPYDSGGIVWYAICGNGCRLMEPPKEPPAPTRTNIYVDVTPTESSGVRDDGTPKTGAADARVKSLAEVPIFHSSEYSGTNKKKSYGYEKEEKGKTRLLQLTVIEKESKRAKGTARIAKSTHQLYDVGTIDNNPLKQAEVASQSLNKQNAEPSDASDQTYTLQRSPKPASTESSAHSKTYFEPFRNTLPRASARNSVEPEIRRKNRLKIDDFPKEYHCNPATGSDLSEKITSDHQMQSNQTDENDCIAATGSLPKSFRILSAEPTVRMCTCSTTPRPVDRGICNCVAYTVDITPTSESPASLLSKIQRTVSESQLLANDIVSPERTLKSETYHENEVAQIGGNSAQAGGPTDQSAKDNEYALLTSESPSYVAGPSDENRLRAGQDVDFRKHKPNQSHSKTSAIEIKTRGDDFKLKFAETKCRCTTKNMEQKRLATADSSSSSDADDVQWGPQSPPDAHSSTLECKVTKHCKETQRQKHAKKYELSQKLSKVQLNEEFNPARNVHVNERPVTPTCLACITPNALDRPRSCKGNRADSESHECQCYKAPTWDDFLAKTMSNIYACRTDRRPKQHIYGRVTKAERKPLVIQQPNSRASWTYGCKNSDANMNVPLNIRQVCLVLKTARWERRAELLQAIRWRLTKESRAVQIKTMQDIAGYDLFKLRCKCGSRSILEDLLWPLNTNVPNTLQESTARLLNAIVSTQLGRNYIGTVSIIETLVWGETIYATPFSYTDRDYVDVPMADQLMATMMKLSLLPVQRTDMIHKGLFRWLIRHIEDVEYSATAYHQEHMIALLMILVGHPNSLEIATERCTQLLSLLVRFMQHPVTEAAHPYKRYVRLVLIDLLHSARLVSCAWQINFPVIVQQMIEKSTDPVELNDLQAMIELLKKTVTSLLSSAPASQMVFKEDQFFQDIQIDSNDPVVAAAGEGGEQLLRAKFCQPTGGHATKAIRKIHGRIEPTTPTNQATTSPANTAYSEPNLSFFRVPQQSRIFAADAHRRVRHNSSSHRRPKTPPVLPAIDHKHDSSKISASTRQVSPKNSILKHAFSPKNSISKHSVSQKNSFSSGASSTKKHISSAVRSPKHSIVTNIASPKSSFSNRTISPKKSISRRSLSPKNSASRHAVSPKSATSSRSVSPKSYALSPSKSISSRSISPNTSSSTRTFSHKRSVSSGGASALPRKSPVPIASSHSNYENSHRPASVSFEMTKSNKPTKQVGDKKGSSSSDKNSATGDETRKRSQSVGQKKPKPTPKAKATGDPVSETGDSQSNVNGLQPSAANDSSSSIKDDQNPEPQNKRVSMSTTQRKSTTDEPKNHEHTCNKCGFVQTVSVVDQCTSMTSIPRAESAQTDGETSTNISVAPIGTIEAEEKPNSSPRSDGTFTALACDTQKFPISNEYYTNPDGCCEECGRPTDVTGNDQQRCVKEELLGVPIKSVEECKFGCDGTVINGYCVTCDRPEMPADQKLMTSDKVIYKHSQDDEPKKLSARQCSVGCLATNGNQPCGPCKRENDDQCKTDFSTLTRKSNEANNNHSQSARKYQDQQYGNGGRTNERMSSSAPSVGFKSSNILNAQPYQNISKSMDHEQSEDPVEMSRWQRNYSGEYETEFEPIERLNAVALMGLPNERQDRYEDAAFDDFAVSDQYQPRSAPEQSRNKRLSRSPARPKCHKDTCIQDCRRCGRRNTEPKANQQPRAMPMQTQSMRLKSKSPCSEQRKRPAQSVFAISDDRSPQDMAIQRYRQTMMDETARSNVGKATPYALQMSKPTKMMTNDGPLSRNDFLPKRPESFSQYTQTPRTSNDSAAQQTSQNQRLSVPIRQIRSTQTITPRSGSLDSVINAVEAELHQTQRDLRLPDQQPQRDLRLPDLQPGGTNRRTLQTAKGSTAIGVCHPPNDCKCCCCMYRRSQECDPATELAAPLRRDDQRRRSMPLEERLSQIQNHAAVLAITASRSRFGTESEFNNHY